MTSPSNYSTTPVSEFLLICFPNYQTWQHWLSLPLSLLFLLAMGANAMLLITIWLEASLHEPMYYLLSLLSLLDIVLCLTVIPKVLAIFWFDLRSISFSACFLQMFIMNSFLPMESCTFMVMAYDRYVAICHPLRYPSIITNQFVAKASAFTVARNALLLSPVPILSSRLHYCGKNVIENCICANLSVSRLSCDKTTVNRAYGLAVALLVVGLDVVAIGISYAFILQTVLKVPGGEARLKAFSTCGSHICVILIFYVPGMFSFLTHRFGHHVPHHVHVLLATLYLLVPPVLNPIVYGVKTRQIRQRVLRVFFPKGWI
ncbi:olfactory receptor 56A1-like [Suricata suricatta]|uniref:olfactory receptor 56A1-like n=1 Tax=Suricata suricatta TaxID=37032 RepID=UPI0011569A93|nr:olfactory receptor 56A1-like [Suricata suricatta]